MAKRSGSSGERVTNELSEPSANRDAGKKMDRIGPSYSAAPRSTGKKRRKSGSWDQADRKRG